MTEKLILSQDPAEKRGSSVRLLIERVKAGDAAAFDQLMICYQRRVVSIAWRMLGNREDARDAAQETFLRVYKHLSSFRADQEFSAWLYRITVNVCNDLARKRGRANQFASLEAERDTDYMRSLASEDDIEAAAIRAQEQALVSDALQSLSRKERAAVVLRDLEGLSTEEVARALGSSQTTVRSQISSARAKIKAFRDRVMKRSKSI